ncbi:translation initiation factor IF-2-like [Hyaena hyaena]|uniref:translation initiation factor IF-2-like n=1 Tax=Hyaena hyaena TaxID=95912 RepID=UPI001925150D|nr:translation initiation factor IF-2-like [Hyaena hyaena]
MTLPKVAKPLQSSFSAPRLLTVALLLLSFRSDTRREAGNLPPQSSMLRSNQPPNQAYTTPLQTRPSPGLHPGPRVSLPASNFPQTRPAPSRARPDRRPLPLPAAPHVLEARVAAGPTHPASACRSSLAALASRPGQPQAEKARARLPSWPPVRREDALLGAGLRSPLTRPLCSEPVSHRRPSQSGPGLRPAPGRWAAARTPRRPRPPPGRLPSSPPHPDPPATPFLTGGRAGFAKGRREPTGIGGLPRARARGLRRRVSPRAPGVSG